MHRVGLGQQLGHHRVARLVIRRVLFLFVGHDHRFALGAHHDLVLGHLEVVHVDQALAPARGEQRGLVDEVGEVGAGEARRAARDDLGLDVRRERHLAHVHQQDLLAAANVGQRHDHLAVEAARAHQRGIEHVRTVGGRDDDDARVALEAVHLDQQLIERLLALVVAAAEARAALAADRVDFVDEHDARRVLLRLLEHVAHARRADADEHLDEVRAGDREERHLGFAGDRLGEQRLAGTRIADHQHAARDAPAQLLELGRVAQELDQLADFFLGLVTAGDVGEGDRVVGFVEHARLALAERERAAPAAALHLAHEEDPHADEQQHREPRDEHLREEALLFLRLGLDLDAVLDQVPDHPQVTGAVRHVVLLVGADPLDRAAFDHGGFDAALSGLFHELGVRHRLARGLPRVELLDDRENHQADDQPDADVLNQIIQRISSVTPVLAANLQFYALLPTLRHGGAVAR